MFLRADQAMGHVIPLRTTHPKHIDESGFKSGEKPDAEKSFGELFLKAFNDVNDLQVNTNKMSETMITDPESVNVHDVMISIAEANLSLSMTKAIVDRALRAYREIVSTR
ncbi:MAG: flagellar hook-basal body complex protein FliE [Spirochaetales bacterium]|nr:flagellar hook-basal body complex protein FliE [Spirochaetales bacterium]